MTDDNPRTKDLSVSFYFILFCSGPKCQRKKNNKNPFHLLFSWYATHVIHAFFFFFFFFYPQNVQKRMSKGEKTLSLKYRNEVSAQ